MEQQPAACQEPAAWLKRSRDRGLALPVVRELVGHEWLKRNRLEALGRHLSDQRFDYSSCLTKQPLTRLLRFLLAMA